MDTVLIVDDNQAVCNALELMLKLNGYEAISCLSAEEALELVATKEIGVVIQDMNFAKDTTSGEEGKALFYRLRQLKPKLPIILLTAWTQLEMAVELVKGGAADYMGKPWDDDKLLTTVKNLLELSRLSRTNEKLVASNAKLTLEHEQHLAALKGAKLCGLVFGSVAMQRCVDLALQLADSDVSVLITGPNGAGKDKIADILHANSHLSDKPFIKVNVGALPIELLEAELFGAEAGAFTGATKTRIGRFEAADGGTLFLDEIGNLPLSGQVKLLRVLQTGEFERLGSHQTRKVKVRVISATNAVLTEDIAAGRFREDLYYRLNVVSLPVLPLCERKEDIIPLVKHFIGVDYSLNPDCKLALESYRWPGNVRELENACKRAVLLARRPELTATDFGLNEVLFNDHNDVVHNQATGFVNESTKANVTPSAVEETTETQSLPQLNELKASVTKKKPLVEPTKEEIIAALTLHQGVIARVAKSLGLSRQALYRRMDKFGIER